MPELKPDDFVRISTLYAPDAVTSLAISPRGDYMAIAAGDKLHIHGVPSSSAVAIATAASQEFPRLVTLHMPDSVQSIAFSPDGKLLTAAIADKVHVYRVPEQTNHSIAVRSLPKRACKEEHYGVVNCRRRSTAPVPWPVPSSCRVTLSCDGLVSRICAGPRPAIWSSVA